MNEQPEALMHAEWLEKSLMIGAAGAAATLRRQHEELIEQCRLNGADAEREAALQAQVEVLRRETDRLKAAMEQQSAITRDELRGMWLKSADGWNFYVDVDTRLFGRTDEQVVTQQLVTEQRPAAPEGMPEFLADLQRSRTKYPKNERMFDALMGEVDELRRAYSGDGDVRAEAFDVAVCAYRIATEGDAGGNSLLSQPFAPESTEMLERFICYLIDNEEGGIITEEGLQQSLAAMLAAAPEHEVVVNSGKTEQKPATNPMVEGFSGGGHVCKPELASAHLNRMSRDDTEHGKHYYLASDVDALLAALPQPEAMGQESHDTKRLDAIARNSWDLLSFSMPTGADDADIGWRVIEHHMAKPHERTVGEVYMDDPRAAIDAAIVASQSSKHHQESAN